MDASRKNQIDQWMENVLYRVLEKIMAKGQINTTDLEPWLPLIQLYQVTQLKKVEDQLDSIWRIMVDGLPVVISDIQDDIAVRVKEMPEPEQTTPKPPPKPLQRNFQRKNQ